MANFRGQDILRAPFGNQFPALKMIDFQIILVLYVPRSVKHPRQSESFHKLCLPVHLAIIYCKLFFDTSCIQKITDITLAYFFQHNSNFSIFLHKVYS